MFKEIIKMVKIYRYYDAKKLAKADNVRVKDIIEYLSKLNPEASMTCCGADLFYFHSSEDGNMITMDNELLEDAYEVLKIKEDIPSINSKESKEEKYIVSSCIKTEPITITIETRDKLINKLIMDNIMKDIMTKRYLKENNITLPNKKV